MLAILMDQVLLLDVVCVMRVTIYYLIIFVVLVEQGVIVVVIQIYVIHVVIDIFYQILNVKAVVTQIAKLAKKKLNAFLVMMVII